MIKFPDIQKFHKLLSTLSINEKRLLYVAIIVVGLFLLDRLIISPIYNKISSLNKDTQTMETGIKRNLRILAQKERILTEVQNYKSFLSKEASDEEITTSFLKEIEELANKSSIYIIDMKPSGIKEERSKIKKYFINLNCEAEMEQIMAFMYSVENAPSLLSIEKYQISPKPKESAIAQCIMTIAKIVIQ